VLTYAGGELVLVLVLVLDLNLPINTLTAIDGSVINVMFFVLDALAIVFMK